MMLGDHRTTTRNRLVPMFRPEIAARLIVTCRKDAAELEPPAVPVAPADAGQQQAPRARPAHSLAVRVASLLTLYGAVTRRASPATASTPRSDAR